MSWRVAYARQAQSDLIARDTLLASPSLPACHQLHFLQMACEKLAKAYLIARGQSPATLQKSHAYIAKQLPIIARQYLASYEPRLHRGTSVIQAIRRLAREIELLAPAVDDGGRSPANCEYPWLLPGGRVIAPAEHKFALGLLHEKAGTTLLKIIRLALTDLVRDDGG